MVLNHDSHSARGPIQELDPPQEAHRPLYLRKKAWYWQHRWNTRRERVVSKIIKQHSNMPSALSRKPNVSFLRADHHRPAAFLSSKPQAFALRFRCPYCRRRTSELKTESSSSAESNPVCCAQLHCRRPYFRDQDKTAAVPKVRAPQQSNWPLWDKGRVRWLL